MTGMLSNNFEHTALAVATWSSVQSGASCLAGGSGTGGGFAGADLDSEIWIEGVGGDGAAGFILASSGDVGVDFSSMGEVVAAGSGLAGITLDGRTATSIRSGTVGKKMSAAKPSRTVRDRFVEVLTAN